MSLVSSEQGNVKKSKKKKKKRWKSMKIPNTYREILHIFQTTLRNSMKFSEKMWLMIILKFTKNQGFPLSLEDKFFEKPQGVGQIDPVSRVRVEDKLNVVR